VTQRQGVGVGAHRPLTFEGFADPVDVHAGLAFGAGADLDADGAVPGDQPARQVVGEQGGLADTGWGVDDQELAAGVGLAPFDGAQRLIGGPHLPRGGAPPHVAQPEKREVRQRPLGVIGQRLGDEVPPDHGPAQPGGSL
jgi:hypothetical protein